MQLENVASTAAGSDAREDDELEKKRKSTYTTYMHAYIQGDKYVLERWVWHLNQ